MALGLLMLFAAPASATIDASGVSSDPSQLSRILAELSASMTDLDFETPGTALPIEQDADIILLGSVRSTLATVSSGPGGGVQLIDLGELLATPALRAAAVLRPSVILEEIDEVYDTTSAPRPPAGPDREAAVFLKAQELVAPRDPLSATSDAATKDEPRR